MAVTAIAYLNNKRSHELKHPSQPPHPESLSETSARHRNDKVLPIKEWLQKTHRESQTYPNPVHQNATILLVKV